MLEALPPYPLTGLAERRRALEAEGVDVIDLGAGDAMLMPPPRAMERLRQSLADPRTSRYGFQLGLPAFREAASAWMHRRFGIEVDPYRGLHPLIGSKEGITHLFPGILDPGDIVVFPDPGYQAYLGGTILAGGEPYPVALRPEHDFLIPFQTIPDEVWERTRALVLNYPNNPTAAIAPRSYFEEAVALCRERGIVLMQDLAYSEIAFDGYRPPSILEIPGAEEVAIEYHSLSKTYNMTGWRLGWAVGNPELIATLARVKSFVDTGTFLGIQEAGIGALESWDDWVPSNVEVFRLRRDAAVAAFREAGFAVESPRATMYLWIPVPGWQDSRTFALRAMEETRVIVLPGSALGEGGEGFFRVALTASESRLEEAAERIGKLIGK